MGGPPGSRSGALGIDHGLLQEVGSVTDWTATAIEPQYVNVGCRFISGIRLFSSFGSATQHRSPLFNVEIKEQKLDLAFPNHHYVDRDAAS